nr:5-epiaristolochene 1,3-dihydroxylase-like [Coffea arabica]
MHHLIGSQPHQALIKLAQKHGALMHLQLGEISSIVVSPSHLAKEIMKTHDLSFTNRLEILLSKIITYNSSDIAFCPYGDYLRQVRKDVFSVRTETSSTTVEWAMSEMIKNPM